MISGRDDNPGMPAVFAPLIVVWIWYLATHGKGNVAARLAAWLAAVIVGWVFLAFIDVSMALHIASGWATGLKTTFVSLDRFFKAL